MSEMVPPHYYEFNHSNWMLPDEDLRKEYFEHHPMSDILWYPERFVPAKLDDYAVWFRGFLQQGGQASGIWDQEYAEGQFARAVTATESFRLDSEVGATSRSIFALPGVQVTGYSGYCKIYELDNCQQVTCRVGNVEPTLNITAPIVTAPEFGTIPGVELEFRRLMQAAISLALANYYQPQANPVITEYLGYAGDLGISVTSADLARMINLAK